MAGEFTITQANGLLKPVFGKLQTTLPELAILQKKYPLSAENQLGDHFEEPVMLRMPQGHSFNGSSGGVVALNSPLAGKTEPAKVYPVEYVLREQVSYGLLDRAKNGGEQAFVSAMALEGKMMTLSARNVLELQALWGQLGLGTVTGNISSHVITIDSDTLCPGILSILEGAKVDVYQSDLATPRRAGLTVSAVDIDAGTVTFDGSATDTSITTGDVLFFAGANSSGTFYEQIGLIKQMQGDNGSGTTGTYFNISKATYSLWRSSVISSVGEFTPSVLVKAATRVQDRGFTAGELDALVSPRAWGVLNSSLMVGEVFQGGYSMSRKTGTDDIQVSNGGVKVNVIAHPFMKQGWAALLPSEYVKRVGAVDLTFAKAGSSDEFLRDVPGYNAMERQCRSQWQMFLERPSQSVLLKGITYST